MMIRLIRRTLVAFCPVLILVLIASAPPARAEVKVPAVFGDNMVLQRDRQVPVWGTASPGEKVTVRFAGQTASATAGQDGKWRATLPAMAANAEPQEMTISGANKLNFKNILVGDVWVASGQSNMEFGVQHSDNGQKEVATADHPQIRLFLVPKRPAPTPMADVAAHWAPSSPKSVDHFSAVAYFFGRELHRELKIPIGLIATSWGGTRIEPWTTAAGAADVPELAGKIPGDQSRLYNGMVAPLIPFAIRGAIWYQGESNNGEGFLYYYRMKALIDGWRKAWGQGDFPFYFVQLAPLGSFYKGDNLPELWEAQTASLSIPNTGMAVTTDIGNVRDIHPHNKQEVGRRLALWALAGTYSRKDVVPSGPLFKAAKVEGDKIRVSYSYVDGGLASRDGKPLTEFEIAGADGKFVPAKATIDLDTVVVESSAVKVPVNVRFGWRRDANPNLVNKVGLPAGPFRSDAPHSMSDVRPPARSVAAKPASAGKWSITHKFLAFGGGRGAQLIAADGRIEWSVPSGANDGQLLASGNILLSLYPNKKYPHGAIVEVTRDGKTVWQWQGTQQEVITAWLLDNGNILTGELGAKPRLVEVGRDGKIAVSVPLSCQTKNVHMETRMARKLPNGNYLVPHLLEKEVREYAPDGRIVSTIKTPNWPFTAIRLDNGHTVIGCTLGNLVVETDAAGKIVWQVTNQDLGAELINDACGVERLPNGDTVFTSYRAGKGPKLMEVTPEKKLVWTFNDGTTNGVHEFQILETNGMKLAGRPLR